MLRENARNFPVGQGHVVIGMPILGFRKDVEDSAFFFDTPLNLEDPAKSSLYF